jgi:dTDP-4-dehydrorhamnose reductase|tara:strand:- start:708 stop:1424 length:717 start_codon:yes stop_codon:yes gene_type:complete
MRILVLGHKGMLGHMVYKVLNNNYKVKTIDERFPNWNKEMFNDVDIIINCIGAIPQKVDKFDINWEIPIWLNENTNCKIIHPATDCEVDVSNYGLSKKRATDYIKNYGKLTKIIQTSIIGPELNSNDSLLEWFLSQRGEVYGYTKAIWNGVTTLEWAKQCEVIINNWDASPLLTILYSDKVSKFRLLHTIQECYGKTDVVIMPKKLGKDKSLTGNVKTKDIRIQIKELINYEKNKTRI